MDLSPCQNEGHRGTGCYWPPPVTWPMRSPRPSKHRSACKFPCGRFFLGKHFLEQMEEVSGWAVRHWPWPGPAAPGSHAFTVRVWSVFSCRMYTVTRIRQDVQGFRRQQEMPANTTQLPDVWPMLDQRRRRWANIGQTLGRCVVFAGSARGRTRCQTTDNKNRTSSAEKIQHNT